MTHPSFEYLDRREIPSLGLTLERYRHRATGARHYHLAADDANNAFLVAFLTVPQDSTGVAHILEHTSLCGSRNYPVRDPFFMMMRRSLATFMNAFTSSDWTAYPFATQSPKDFDNLLRVYLDATFFPSLEEMDFLQEGHRVEPADPANPDGELVFKGVVFNEMKGAMSTPVSRLWQLLQEHLYPTTTYHYNSGGDPERIPDLTYDQLKAFHRRHYHPSNAVFMTYGDLPAEGHQARFEELALRHFERLDLDLAVPDEQRYREPRVVAGVYPLEGETDTARRSHVVLGWLLGNTTDLRGTLEAHLLSEVLLDNSASPLRRALETSDLGSAPSELCGYSDSAREGSFSCGLEGTDPECAEAIEALVLGVLEEVARDGVPQDIVESVLHQLELSQREITGGHFPYGLRLMVNALSPTLHGGDPGEFLDLDPALAWLREAIADPGYVPGLVRRLLLDNPHRVRVTLAPDLQLAAAQVEREKARLAELGRALTGAEREALAARAAALAERQQRQDDPGILPKVGLEDVPADLKVAEGRPRPVNGVDATWYAQGTNGLVYAKVVADMPELAPGLADLMPVFCDCVTEVGCGAMDYLQAQARQAAVTGGMGASYSLRGEVDDVARTRGYYVLSAKALVRNTGPMVELLRDVHRGARFDELPRLRELVAQLRLHREMGVTDHGHALAMTAAASGIAPAAALAHRWNGLLGISRLKALDDSLKDSAALARLGGDLAAIAAALAGAPQRLLVVCEEQATATVAAALEAVWSGAAEIRNGAPFRVGDGLAPVAEGWAVNSQVNYCARAYGTVPLEHPDGAPLMVLGRFLTNGFLHRTIREQGGAYGAGAGYDSDSGAFRFYSYRDPRLAGTLADFDRSLEWLADGSQGPREVEEAILGVVSTIDRPESPAGEASRAFFGDLHGRTAAQRRRFRQRVLAVTLDDLRRVGETWLRPAAANTAVVSNASTLEREAPGLGLAVRRL